MALTQMDDFTFKHSGQLDAIYTQFTANQIKALFDSRGIEIRTALNLLITALKSTEGASDIGTSTITDIDGSDIQAMLKSIRDKLKSKTDGTSGADFVNATAISGLNGETVQSLLESLKTYADSLTASDIDATPIASGSGTTVQGQLAWLLSQIAIAATGSIPDGTLTEAKLTQALIDKINAALSNTGVLTTLLTIDKSSLVNALNEHLAENVSDSEVHGIRVNQSTKAFEYYDGTEWKTVSGGIPVGNLLNFTATAGNAKITLKWTDPNDVIIDGATIAKWAGTKILRKIGSYPVNQNDGTLIIDSAIKNQYQTNGYADTGLTNDTTYYYMAFPYTTASTYTVNETNRVTSTPKATQIYGVKIDTTNSNPSTALTYTDNAVDFTPATGNNGAFSYGSWQDKFPVNAIKPCLYKNGMVNYYLNPNDYTKKVDGSAADITSGNDGDVMVEFPKIYWKFQTVGTDLYIRYSDTKIDSSYKCLAHMRGTTEKDKCYLSAYLGNTISSKLRSLSGKTPTVSQTIGVFRNQAQANGSGYDQMAYYQLLMLQVLFIVMFKSRDSQTALGRGYVDGNSAAISTGGTDKKGLFYGETTGKLQNKFCGIEDFWGNCYYWIDGFFCNASRNILIANQSFNDTGSGYADYDQGATSDLSGYISGIQGGTETGFVVKATNGSTTTYYCDFGALYASCLPVFGGYWSAGDDAGAFRLFASYGASGATSSIASRLLAL